MSKKRQNKNDEDALFTTDSGDDVTFSDLLKTIYQNSVEKQKHLKETAKLAIGKIKTLPDTIALLPYLTGLESVSVKNDEQLVKLAAIVNRQKTGKGSDQVSDEILTQEDRRLLMEQIKTHVPGSASDF